jgi:hypothetical protein
VNNVLFRFCLCLILCLQFSLLSFFQDKLLRGIAFEGLHGNLEIQNGNGQSSPAKASQLQLLTAAIATDKNGKAKWEKAGQNWKMTAEKAVV